MDFPVFSFTLHRPHLAGKALILNSVAVGLRAGRYSVFESPAGDDPPLFAFNLRNQHVPGQALVIQNLPISLDALTYDVLVYPHVLVEGGGGFSILLETGGYVAVQPGEEPIVFASSV